MASKLLALLISLILLSLWGRLIPKVFRKLRYQRSHRHLYLAEKLTQYGGSLGLSLITLRWLGVDLNGVLATAGVLTLTVGFAAKTSISHLISGLILLGAKFFKQGDLIEVGSYLGVVEGMDVFSTRLRTFDNVIVSIPNEKLLTECVSNYSEYPIRRMTVEFLLCPEDVDAQLVPSLQAELSELSEVLIEPAPLIILESQPGRGLLLGVRAWCESQRFVEARNQVTLSVISYLRARHIRYGGESRFVTQLEAKRGATDEP